MSAPTRFLHIADIHLGCRQYHSKQRQRDFYLAFDSAVSRFALPLEEGGPAQVDFVVLPGDLFDHRNLQPITLSRATDVLSQLKEAGIPVFACEGNHDAARRHEPGEPNWYDFLCAEGFLIYLRDTIEDGQILLEPWDEELRAGGYYEFANGVRIVGSQWYGAQAHAMIGPLTQALSALPPSPFSILLFHGGLTDYVNALSAGVEYEQFLALRPYVDYLALGHVHKRYERQGWLFNPGSLEACKLREFFEEHGAYRVEILDAGGCRAEHLDAYRKRPFLWLELSCDLFDTPEALEAALRSLILEQGRAQLQQLRESWPPEISWVAPICHVEFCGCLGFPFSKLPLKELSPWICEQLEAEMFRHRNDTSPRQLGGTDLPMREGRIDREALERRIFSALFREDSRYQHRAEPLAECAVELKKQLLEESLDERERRSFCDEIAGILEAPAPEQASFDEAPLDPSKEPDSPPSEPDVLAPLEPSEPAEAEESPAKT